MQKPNLPEISAADTKVISQVHASELENEWVRIDDTDTFVNIKGLLDFSRVKESVDVEIRSYKYQGGRRFQLGFRIKNRQNADSKIDANQEFVLFKKDNDMKFECPLSEETLECETLYLRSDYPLFGSAEFLNIKE